MFLDLANVDGEREAMWLSFTVSNSRGGSCDAPFAVKVYAGGVNAVSGKPSSTKQVPSANGDSDAVVQDYVVPPKQQWLDGIARKDGFVSQFVATPSNSGYSVEEQLTGADKISGIQFEITPRKLVAKDTCQTYDWSSNMQIFVRGLDNKTITLAVSAWFTIEQVKMLVEDKTGIPCDQQRLTFGMHQLDDTFGVNGTLTEQSTLCAFLIKRQVPVSMIMASDRFVPNLFQY